MKKTISFHLRRGIIKLSKNLEHITKHLLSGTDRLPSSLYDCFALISQIDQRLLITTNFLWHEPQLSAVDTDSTSTISKWQIS